MQGGQLEYCSLGMRDQRLYMLRPPPPPPLGRPTRSKQSRQYTGRSPRGWNGTFGRLAAAAASHIEHLALDTRRPAETTTTAATTSHRLRARYGAGRGRNGSASVR